MWSNKILFTLILFYIRSYRTGKESFGAIREEHLIKLHSVYILTVMCSLKRSGSCRCKKVFQSRAEAWLEGPDVHCLRMSTELVSRVVESTQTEVRSSELL